MKLSDSKVNPENIEKGAWIGEKYGTPIPDMGDLCLNVRGLNNDDYDKRVQALIDAEPRKNRRGGRLSPASQKRVTSICLRDTVLLGWENLIGDGVVGEDGKPVEFSKKTADQLLTGREYRRFYDAVIWAASIVGEQVQADEEEIVGN